MKKGRKGAFLILRLPQEWKAAIEDKAKQAGLTISAYIRGHIDKMLNG